MWESISLGRSFCGKEDASPSESECWLWVVTNSLVSPTPLGCYRTRWSTFFQLFSSVQSLSYVQLFATPWTAARQASLSTTNSKSLPKLMSIELVMHPAISFSVIPFSSCPQSFPASGSVQLLEEYLALCDFLCFPVCLQGSWWPGFIWKTKCYVGMENIWHMYHLIHSGTHARHH